MRCTSIYLDQEISTESHVDWFWREGFCHAEIEGLSIA